MQTLDRAAAAVTTALARLNASRGEGDWGLAGTRPGQYHSDLVADPVAVKVLVEAGLGVVSEESGLHHPDRSIQVVLDPVDGSTNASRGLPWFATSLCAVDAGGPLAALVINQATGERFEAVRGAGALHDGGPCQPSGQTDLARSVVGLSGWPGEPLGWAQFRAYGAAALDLCSVACGRFDAYLSAGPGHAPWDYLGGLLVCQEAGVAVVEAGGRDLITLDPGGRRAVVAGSAALVESLLDRPGR
ncbi:MAG: inositol monophosphatase family protein [Acidimicrobiales bacterium]